MKKTIYLSLIAALVLSSCTKANLNNKSEEISFTTTIQTKATSTAFETGDKMSIWAVEQGGEETIPLQLGGNYINNECLTYDGAKWVSQWPLYWSSKPCDFIAVYPYLNNVTSIEKQKYMLPLDQNKPESGDELSGYEAADVMYAKSQNVSSDEGTVHLKFQHMLSKCTVKIIKGEKFEGEIPDDIVVHIYNTTIEYLLDLSKGSVAKYGLGSRKTITMRKHSNELFDAIVVPQNIELSTPLIEVTMGGIAYLLNYSISFKPGYNHTINLTVNTSPDQENIEISIDPGVNPWD